VKPLLSQRLHSGAGSQRNVSDTDVHNGQHAVGQQGGDQRGEGAPLAGGSPFLGKPFCDMGQAEPLQLKGSHMDHSSLTPAGKAFSL
jgi:hypothetical protein